MPIAPILPAERLDTRLFAIEHTLVTLRANGQLTPPALRHELAEMELDLTHLDAPAERQGVVDRLLAEIRSLWILSPAAS